MKDSEGNLDQFRLMLKGEKPASKPAKKEEPRKDQEPERRFPWGREWLSVHNPFLFRGF